MVQKKAGVGSALRNINATHDIDVVAVADLLDLLYLEGGWRLVFLAVEISARQPALREWCADHCGHILRVDDWELNVERLLVQQR